MYSVVLSLDLLVKRNYLTAIIYYKIVIQLLRIFIIYSYR